MIFSTIKRTLAGLLVQVGLVGLVNLICSVGLEGRVGLDIRDASAVMRIFPTMSSALYVDCL